MWILKIFFDNDFKAKEIQYRKSLLNHNQILIQELEKFKKMRKVYSSDKLNKESIKNLLMTIDVQEAIYNIRKINIVIGYLWLSRKNIDYLQNFVINIKNTFHKIIEQTDLLRFIDTYKSDSVNSIFNQKKKIIQLDQFIR